MRDGKGGLRGRIFITGPSGSGKSTLARYLRKQGTLAVDADAIPRLMRVVDPRGRPLRGISHEQYLQADGWQNFWDENTLQRFLSRNSDIVVCGASDNMFNLDLARLFDRRIFLRAPWAVIHARLDDPKRDNDWGRDTRPAQRAWVRRAARTWPSLARASGFEVVDASLPLAEILRQIGGSPLRSRERSCERSSGASPVRIAQVAVPDYTVAREPDYHAIGVKVDQAVEAEFPDGTYVVRAIGLDDHPGLHHDDLIAIILDRGTDKYDPSRKGVAHDDFKDYDYDIHAGPLRMRNSRLVLDKFDRERGGRSWFGGVVWHFYNGAPIDRGHPVRLDLLIFYDARKLVKARKLNSRTKGVRRGLGRHLYRFKNRQDKRSALLGLVEVLR
ncbi:MAG: dephospho-CoA kinase [Euryarchaeota archaeon]|nr:dephospho-CoA kinase [Euryarchaeota archaeon]MDE2045296.1 dephospho-CoA kinase [Thermoplasmata archaeon]